MFRNRSVLISCLFILSICTLGGITQLNAAVAADDDKYNGIKITLPEQKVNLKIGGRVFGDWMWGSADEEFENAFGRLVSGNEWRAAWIELSGDYDGAISFRVWYDISGDKAVAKDVWLGFDKLPIGSLRFGHMKEPFSLEQMVSSKNTVFMERSLANVFAPARNTGVGVFGNANNISWGVGLFTDSDDLGKATIHDDTYNFTARVTFLPWNARDMILHLGAAHHLRNVKEGGTVRFRARPEAHLAYRMVDTGNLAADSVNMVGFEGALLIGRAMVQGEYIDVFVDAPALDDPNFEGFYVFGSFFITNDRHGYSKGSGTVGGVTPKNPFCAEGGLGAWEVAFRYSRLDLNDGVMLGGMLKDVTMGVNWYLNKYSRLMFNYVYANHDDLGTANIFQMRYQFSF